MLKRNMLLTLMLTTVLGIVGISSPASAQNDLAGVTAFLASGNSYLPLQKVASFLGADLSWDVVKNQAVMTYQGKNLVLTPNNLTALFDNNKVALPSPPVVVKGRTYIPASALKKTYGIPIEWDKSKSQVKVKGPNGWSSVNVSSRPPWHGGPPPWAPAWGARNKHHMQYNAKPAYNHNPVKHPVQKVKKQKTHGKSGR